MKGNATPWYRPTLSKRDFAIGALVVGLIMIPYLIWMVHGVLHDRDLLLARVQALGPERILAIQFKSQHSNVEGPDCFWLRSPAEIATATKNLVQAKPLSRGGQLTPALDFAMIIHFTTGESEKFLGTIYRQKPRHVFFSQSHWTSGHFSEGSWTTSSHLEIRIPGWAPWVYRNFEENDCPGILREKRGHSTFSGYALIGSTPNRVLHWSGKSRMSPYFARDWATADHRCFNSSTR